ncbi:MAG: O-antigen ligase family protein [Bacteroidales bacterium]|nr:O-antigen ligase family protein [Bacteroidales bacterium]
MKDKNLILWLYYFGIGLMLTALPFSNYFMSISQFVLSGALVLDGMSKADVTRFFKKYSPATVVLLIVPYGLMWIFQAIGRKIREFFRAENAPAWVFASIYLMHLLGLFFTSDFNYALKDLRIKLPILILPLILSTTCLTDRRSFRVFMYLFIAAVVTGTIISTFIAVSRDLTDSRESSIFISHIRFSMLIDIAIFAVAYIVFKKSDISRWIRVVLGAAGLWMVAFLIIFAYMTGLVILIIVAIIMLFYLAMVKGRLMVKLAVAAGIVLILSITVLYIRDIGRDINRIHPTDLSSLEKGTKNGNPYYHDTLNLQVENGHYVWIYLAMDEMAEAWDKRSTYHFEGKDKAGQEMKSTLIRFLTSKGYRKDAEGVARLTDEEVAMVEEGIASTVYVEKPNLYVRIYKIFWEYQRYQVTRNPSGHSVMQRIEYWRASVALIRDNWLTGVGTGDIEYAFQEKYYAMGSLLSPEYRWRAHNQFLAIFVMFGVFGMAWFLFSLFFPAARLVKFHDYYYLTFFIIIILSMLTEDTLETQAGVTQFAFFSSWYLFAKKFIDII